MPARIVRVAERDRRPIEIDGVRQTALDGDALLVTAGAWARAMSSRFGEPIPLMVRGPQMAVTEPLPYRIAPVLGVSSPLALETVYLRQVTCGTIVFCGGNRGPADLEAGRAHVGLENTLHQPPQPRRLLPRIVAVRIIRCGAALRAICLTICPSWARARRYPGCFTHSASAAQASRPAVGVVMTELIDTGRRSIPADAARIGHFAQQKAA